MLDACEIKSLDAFELQLTLLQSDIIGHLLFANDAHYEVRLGMAEDAPDERYISLRCRIDNVEVSVTFAPQCDRGWLGEHQITPEMLKNPMLARVYADHLIAGAPEWVSDIRLGESIRSPYTIKVVLTPPERLDQPRFDAFLSVEMMEDFERLRRGLDRHMVLADKQRLDHFKVDLPLVAATASLTADEIAALQTTDIIRLT